jgi:dipeptidyl aminopeptidase/acylaminoacyl peptidase
MKYWGIFTCLILFTLTPKTVEAIQTQNQLVPLEHFAALPYFSNAKLSPDGRKVGFLTTYEGQKHLVVEDLYSNTNQFIAPIKKGEFSTFYWANKKTIVIEFDMTIRHFGGRNVSETKLFSFNLTNNTFKWLGQPEKTTNSKAQQLSSQFERMLYLLPDDPNHILMGMDFERDGSVAIYKVNLVSGVRSTLQNGRRGIQNWYLDQNGEPRFGTGFNNKNEWQSYWRTQEGKWVRNKNPEWLEKYSIAGFSDHPDIIYVRGYSSEGTIGVYTLSLTSGKIESTVQENSEVDIEYIVRHPGSGEIAGVGYYNDFFEIKYIDQNLSALHSSLSAVLKDKRVSITSKARDAEIYLIQAYHSNDPGHYYLFDLEKKSLTPLLSRMANIKPEQMAKTISIKITVRDGSQIPGYLTLPNSHEPGSKLPAIILPHGGPSSRDTADWDYWAQFYANRGYAVLKPNFRGSTGYGITFENKGEQEWGGLMQDDVTDATKWLIAEGIADPNRICIVGASYGGYAALMGTIKEQGLYACAVSVNGVPNIPKIKTYDKGFIGGKSWVDSMSRKGFKDKEISPYHLAEKVSAPILLLASKDDTRIPYKHSQAMHKKLKSLKKPSKYLRIKDGGHSMDTEAARLMLLEETEKFLAKHIGN